MKAAVTTADTSIAAGDLSFIAQTIEGYNFLPLKGKTIYMSFWVKSSLIGTYCVAFRNSASSRSFIKTYTISVANTWELKTMTLTHDPTGTWDYTNGGGMSVTWTLMSGSSFFAPAADTWYAGSYIAVSGQVNFVGTVSNTFFLSQVQLYEGTTSLDFEGVQIEAELRQCMRYYEKSIAHDSQVFTTFAFSGGSLRGSATELAHIAKFLVEKRATPTVSFFAPMSGTSGVFRDLTVSADTSAGAADPSPTGIRFTHSALTASRWYGVNWTANAEL
jgi:hypothetical protein